LLEAVMRKAGKALARSRQETNKANVKKTYFGATALTLMACASPGTLLAQANIYASMGDLSYLPSSYITASATATNPDEKFGSDKTARGFGLRIGMPIYRMWDLQLGSNYSRYHDGGLRYQQNTLGVDALFLFSRSRFRPFLMVGAGAEYNKVSAGGVDQHRTSPYVSGGAGLQVSLNDRWGMQADFRRAHSYLNGDSFPFKRANTNTVSLGITYALGKPMIAARSARALDPVVSPPAPPAPSPPAVAQAPAPAPFAPPPAAPPPPRFEKYTLSATELFAFDSAVLNTPQEKLDEISDALIRNPQLGTVTITGYTDRLGSEKYNLALSQRRADAVKNFMTSKGVAANRLAATGKGESSPVVICNDKNRASLIVCLEPNRRVEVDQIVIERRIP
jgi:OmpA-OmpF porin, OOP family